MIDLHTHILPGLDDGVETEDEAVEFARAAVEDGVRTMVATPHCREGFYFVDRETALREVARLRERLERERVALELLPGAEVHLCPDLPARIADGRAPTLADNRKTLLLELSLSQYPVELQNVVFQLKLAGVVPLLAHPERIRYFSDDPRRYEELVRLGAYGQITTGSILGTFGDTAQEYSQELLRKGLVHALASDAHNVRGRPPRLRRAAEAVAGMAGEGFAEALCEAGPRALLNGGEPELPEPEAPRRRARSGGLGRWFRRR